MKSIKIFAMVTLVAMMSSFTKPFGGEGFEIYLNGKVWVQQYGEKMNGVKVLSLDNTTANDQLSIKYHHCGKTGLNRIVSIKDEHDNLLKEFRFENVDQPVAEMKIRLGDITSLKKGSGLLRLYYTSSELPKGRMLASLKPAGTVVSKVK